MRLVDEQLVELHHEYVLVGERRAEAGRGDGPVDGLDGAHIDPCVAYEIVSSVSPPGSTSRSRYADWRSSGSSRSRRAVPW